MWMNYIIVMSSVGWYISEWDNKMNEAQKVWKQQTGSLLCDLLSENGYHSIDK